MDRPSAYTPTVGDLIGFLEQFPSGTRVVIDDPGAHPGGLVAPHISQLRSPDETEIALMIATPSDVAYLREYRRSQLKIIY